MKETFAIPAVGAIIRKRMGDDEYILVQNRKKKSGDGMDGLLEIPAGKIREYENIFEALKREVWEETGLQITSVSGAYSIILSTFLCEAEGELLERTNETENIRWLKREELKEIVENKPESMFLMHVHALRKYLGI